MRFKSEVTGLEEMDRRIGLVAPERFRAGVVASAVAALFMIQLGQLVLSLGASPASQLLVQAIAIVLATGIRNLPAMMHRR